MNKALFLVLTWCVLAPTVGSAGVRRVPRGDSAEAASCRILDYAISPDGHFLAETRACSGNLVPAESIAVRNLQKLSETERIVFGGSGLSGVRWIGNRHIAFVIAGPSYTVAIQDVRSLKLDRIARFRRPVALDSWCPHRRLMVLSTARSWRWNGRVSVRMRDSMSSLGLIAPRWARATSENVELIRVGGASTAIGTRVHLAMRQFATMPDFAWRHRELLGLVQSQSSYRSRIFDLLSGHRVDRTIPLFDMGLMTVSDNGRIAVTSTHVWKTRPRATAGWGGSQNVYVVLGHGEVQRLSAFTNHSHLIAITGLWWSRDGNLVAQVMGSSKPGGPLHWWLEEVNWRRDVLVRSFGWPNGDLGGIGDRCKFDRLRTVGVCVAQTLTTPPDLVELNLKTGTSTEIGEVDPGERPLTFAFRDILIRNRFGDASTAYLAVPRVAVNHAVPLAVMAYGFTRAYSRDAQWITSYPVAKLVHSGIAVCMVNWSDVPGLRVRGFRDELRLMRGDVSTLEDAVPAVRAAGVRVSRAMIMGWSFGGLFGARVIDRDSTYVAAEIGDPAEWSVAGYALGNEQWRVMSRWGLGGPPVGRFFKNYLRLDPVGSGAAPRGPVLVEFVSRHPAVGQLIQEWRGVGAKLEVFAYRRSVHWLNVQAEARISRLRNLYWAKLNLLGPRSVTETELRKVQLTVPANGWWSRKAGR